MLVMHPDDIEVGERHRALSSDAVERLAKSMADIGLRHPISVRVVDEMVLEGQTISGVPVLVSGAHRLAAAKSLGWERIDCIEVDDNAITAELWELAENLHRLDLTKEQRDGHIRRYAELLEAQATIPQQNAAVLPARGPGQPKGTARKIADETGLSVDTVRRALNPPEPKSPLADYDVVTVQFNALMAAWNRACSDARSRFVDSIEGAL